MSAQQRDDISARSWKTTSSMGQGGDACASLSGTSVLARACSKAKVPHALATAKVVRVPNQPQLPSDKQWKEEGTRLVCLK